MELPDAGGESTRSRVTGVGDTHLKRGSTPQERLRRHVVRQGQHSNFKPSHMSNMQKLGLEKRQLGRNLITECHYLKHQDIVPQKRLIRERFQ